MLPGTPFPGESYLRTVLDHASSFRREILVRDASAILAPARDMASDTIQRRPASLGRRFLEIASDPRLIPGVHHHCDEWCQYCPVTERCLTFRCTEAFRAAHQRGAHDPTFASLEEAVGFTRQLAAIEGTSTAELDALVSEGAEASGMQTSDRLAGLALEYAVRIRTNLGAAAALMTANAPPTPGGPRPEEVLLWYHVRIYMRLVRALVAKEGKGPGGIRLDDALGSAKLVLVAVQKSRAAIQRLQQQGGDDMRELMPMLDALERGIDERFPGARSFVRFGLDVPVV